MDSKRARILAVILVTVSILFVGSVAAEEAEVPTTTTIMGKITSGEKKAPAAGVTVVGYHLATEEVFRSAPTLEDGRFVITDIPHGYYDIAVQTPDGLYAGQQVINATPGGEAVANFQLAPPVPGEDVTRSFPGLDDEVTGIAQLVEKGNKKKKIIILTAAGAGVVAVLASMGSSSSSSDDSPSPSTPGN